MAEKTGSEKRELFEHEALPHVDALYRAALRLSRNPDDARDLLQETLLRAYRYFHQYTPGTNCRAWLLTILYNNFRNGYRGAGREQLSATLQGAVKNGQPEFQVHVKIGFRLEGDTV
jgi:RNA polymerase sigma-70 factor (ECF subfamily)